MAAQKFLFKWRKAMQEAPELTSTDRHVGLVVSLHADTNTGGDSFPSITTIAALTARKRATVIKSIVRLEEQGWLHVERRNLPGKQARAKSYYTLTIPTKVVPVEAPGLVPVEAPASDAAEVVPVEAEVVPIEDGGGARRDTNLVPEGAPELSLTSPSTSQRTQKSLVVGSDVDARERIDPGDYDGWNVADYIVEPDEHGRTIIWQRDTWGDKPIWEIATDDNPFGPRLGAQPLAA